MIRYREPEGPPESSLLMKSIGEEGRKEVALWLEERHLDAESLAKTGLRSWGRSHVAVSSKLGSYP